MKEISVPISVIRAGKAEKYIRAKTELDDARKSLEALEEEYSKILSRIRKSFSEYTWTFKKEGAYKTYCFSGDVWEIALVYEQFSKQLVETAGKVKEAIVRECQAESDFNEVIAD